MAQRTLVTENNIHNWVGEAQFNRGLQYVQEGLTEPHSQRGRVIRGWCYPRDTQTGAYFVWARTAGIRICDAECTCPLGKYGICPHVAAVLLHYVRNPASFRRSWWQRLFGFKHRVERVAVTPDTGQTTPVQNPPHRQNVA